MEEQAVNIIVREGFNQQLRVILITESGKVVGGDGMGSLNLTKMMLFMKITSETEQISNTSTYIVLNRYLSAFTMSTQCRVKIT